MFSLVFFGFLSLLVITFLVSILRYRYLSNVIAKCKHKLDTSYGSKGVITGPPPVPFLGNVLHLDVMNNMAEGLRQLSLIYGRMFECHIGPKKFLIVGDPGVLRQIFATEWESFDRAEGPHVSAFADLAGGLILQKNGPEWKEMRNLIQPLFHGKNLNYFTETAVRQRVIRLCERVGDFCDKGQDFDIENEFQLLTFDVIGDVAFGIDLESQNSFSGQSKYKDAFETLLNVSMLRSMVPGYLWWWNYVDLLPCDRKYTQSRKTMHGIVEQVIEHYKQELAKTKNSAEGESGQGGISERQQQCVLSRLLKLREETGTNISDRTILLNIMTVLFAGHDTTMNSITWAIYYLYRDPHVLAKVRAEMAEKLSEGDDVLSRPHEIDSLAYLRAVVKESMRLRMSAPMGVGRVCVADTKIEWIGTDGKTTNTHLVKKGDCIMSSPWIIHLHPQNWSDPETFDPDRFVGDKEYHPAAYIPFGIGPRSCIGEKLAWREVMMACVALIQRFDLTIRNPDDVKPKMSATLRVVGGMTVNAKRI